MDPDGMSYVEMASRAAQHGAGELINGYWSPAYPGLLALTYCAVHPSPDLEFPLVHFVNFLIFAFALAAFTFLMTSWPVRGETGASGRVASFGFAVFLWFAIEFIGVRIVTPDLLLSGFVFLAAAICWRIARRKTSRVQFVLLGVVLAAGYYAKAVMLPITVLLLLLLLVAPPWRQSNALMRMKVLISAFVFIFCAAPFVILESRHVGHFSTGETGPLNYAWFADQAFPLDGAAWKASIGGANGILRHAPRVLVADPTVLEFGSPIPGTYPLHYDASYWFAGTKPHFRVDAQLRALTRTLFRYLHMVRLMWALLAGIVAGFIAVRSRGSELVSAIPRWLLAWPLGVCALYLFVHTEERLVAAFLVLFWLGIYIALYEIAKERGNVTLIPTVVSLILALTCSAGVLLEAGRALRRAYGNSGSPEYVRTALWLKDAGLEKGDSIAFAGLPYDAYYAHYLGIRIVAEIVDPSAFSHMTSAELANVSEALRKVGIKAIIARDSGTRGSLVDSWKHTSVSGSRGLSVLMLGSDTRGTTLWTTARIRSANQNSNRYSP